MAEKRKKSKKTGFSLEPSFISSILIEDLFGIYTYRIQPESNDQDISRLLILYGDNGTGKTTILNLLYGALRSTI